MRSVEPNFFKPLRSQLCPPHHGLFERRRYIIAESSRKLNSSCSRHARVPYSGILNSGKYGKKTRSISCAWAHPVITLLAFNLNSPVAVEIPTMQRIPMSDER